MVDFDVRLGLTPTDLVLREITIKRPDDWDELNPDDDPEIRIIQAQFGDDIVDRGFFDIRR